MATFTWLAVSGDLDSTSNWSQPDPNNPVLPGVSDNAIFDATGTVFGSVVASGVYFFSDSTLNAGLPDGFSIEGVSEFQVNGSITLESGTVGVETLMVGETADSPTESTRLTLAWCTPGVR